MFKSMMYDTDIRNRGTDPREDRNINQPPAPEVTRAER